MRNWFVITGAPSAGKTTLIEALEKRGLHVEYESARILLDEGISIGKTVEELRSDEEQFQNAVYEHKRLREEHLDQNELIFFDRGLHDTVAYYTLHGFSIPPLMQTKINEVGYRKVFLLEPFSYDEDYARTESESEQKRLFTLLKDAYERLYIPLTIVPSFPTMDERITYFIDLLNKEKGLDIVV